MTPGIGTRFGTRRISIGPHRGRSTTTAEFPAPTGPGRAALPWSKTDMSPTTESNGEDAPNAPNLVVARLLDYFGRRTNRQRRLWNRGPSVSCRRPLRRATSSRAWQHRLPSASPAGQPELRTTRGPSHHSRCRTRRGEPSRGFADARRPRPKPGPRAGATHPGGVGAIVPPSSNEAESAVPKP